MIEVRLFGALRGRVGKAVVYVNASETTLGELLRMVAVAGGGTLYDLVVEGGSIKRGVRVLVNGVDASRLGGLSAAVKSGDKILIGPPLSAGGMVDITPKPFSYREAEAEGVIRLRPETVRLIAEGRVEKGNVHEAVKIAAINAVKSTPSILPYCHPIKITGVDVAMELLDSGVRVRVTVRSVEQTGVEMEALVGTTVGLLTVWDMVKKYEKDEEGRYPHTRIEYIRVVRKEKRTLG
ncbi:cyclic pyranopterin monophosphate synthase MoaC [Candidatus Geothermarchaeota archaeon ex4572_27]|nr:MAG: cyclic pyranopterin monophosphate synthase MoaC [Candidatus Geothermarchaeota archaeon ex4572_27]